MPYVPYYDPDGWEDDPSTDTPITAAALNHIEAGVEAVAASADAAQTTADAAQTTATAAIPKSLVDAKGDLLAASAADTVGRLAVGTNGQLLTAASGETLGVKWADAPASGVTPVQLVAPRVTSLAGNSFWSVLGLTDWDAGHWEFVKDVDGKVYGSVLVPSGVSSATLRLAVAANATSGVTRLGVGYAAVADGESLNPASLTDVTKQDITVPATAYLRKDVTFSLTGLAGADLVLVEVFHEGSHANDTLAANTLLFGAWLEPA